MAQVVELRSAPALLAGKHRRGLRIIRARDVARVAGPWLHVMEVEHGLRALINRRLRYLCKRL